MDYFSRLIVVVVLVVVSTTAAGQSAQCYQWSRGGTGEPWFDSPSDLAAYLKGVFNSAAFKAGTSIGNCQSQAAAGANATIVYNSVTPVIRPTFAFPVYDMTVNCTITGATQANMNGTFNPTYSVINRVNPAGCPSCPSSGTSTNLLPSENASVPAGAANLCLNECAYSYSPGAFRITATGVSRTLASIKATGRACGATQPPTQAAQGTNDDCFMDGGRQICADPAASCGYVNNDRICTRQQTSGCTAYASGGVACIVESGGAVPGAPDNGTPGQPATPTAIVSNSNVTINYYNQTAVNNSSVPPSTTPAEGGGPKGVETGGECEGEECGEEGSVTGGALCDAPPVCDGDALQCAMIAQQWRTRCPDELTETGIEAEVGLPAEIDHEEHDMSEALSQVVVTGGSGVCPAPPSVALPGGGSVEITVITWFCELAALLAPLVMIAAYAAGALIVGGKL